MSSESIEYRAARDIAVVLLRPIANPTSDQVLNAAVNGLAAAGNPPGVDLEELTADLLHSFDIFAGSGTALDDPRGHVDWLPTKRGSIEWHFWHRYETWLEQEKKFPPPVVRGLGELTDEILKRLEDPAREGSWSRRGMVVGSVQSGKTGNYIGLICKAVDAGYKLVIVLAGMHNSLRSQTQLRIDEGFLGFDTEKDRALNQNNIRKGVGLLPSGQTLHVMSLTSSIELGDFSKKVANNLMTTLGGVPTVLIVKKNGRILKTLKEWLLQVGGQEESGNGKKVIRNVPLLLIDDEADQASINTRSRPDADEEESVTMINRRIREVLQSFQKNGYVGYTATPFANIFINPSAQTEKLGDDIFPRSFILNVRPPGTYFGPARVFGLDGDPDAGIEGRDPLPVVKVVSDYGETFPPKHKIDHVPEDLPPSLRHAIRCFVLACAARRARGQEREHTSMLVHVTRFVSVQGRVTDLIKEELDLLRKRISYGDGARAQNVRDELRAIWADEFAKPYASLRDAAPDEVGQPLSWSQVDSALHEAVSKIEAKQINGTAKDALDYVDHPDGFSVIAVGGNKLSRGLTLEGLCISYFLRTSRMYDTLMQMGRWFGYRPGYLDLCRLFTTAELIVWYRHIALAEEELRREFDYMATSGLTPENYGLRVRSHSDGLLVTALNKMCHAETLQLSYAGELVQTGHFSTDESVRLTNVQVVNEFLLAHGKPTTYPPTGKPQAFMWRDIGADEICDQLLTRIHIHPRCLRLDARRVCDFIRQQTAQGELTMWTVALVSNSQAPASQMRTVAGQSVGLTERTPESDEDLSHGVYSAKKANIQSPSHQAFDLTQFVLNDAMINKLSEKEHRPGRPLFDADDMNLLRRNVGQKLDLVAFALTQDRARRKNKPEPDRPNGIYIRELRPVTHGLLLIYVLAPDVAHLKSDESPYIGLALSFPKSHTARFVSYRANQILIQQLQDGAYED
jgi:hypothetical protein